MNTRILLSFLIAISLSVGLYLYWQNTQLAREIAASDEKCESQIAQMESRYFSQYMAAVGELQEPPPEHRIRDSAIHSGEKKKARYNNLVSYGHRVRAVAHKYEFLLASAQIDDTQRKHLRKLLMERERLVSTIEQITGESANVAAADIGQMKSTLYDVEEQIEFLLKDPIDYTRYQYLREKML